MTAPKNKRREPGWITVLEGNPDYLKAIGTIAVEAVNLEVMLADLLCYVLGIHPDTGDAMYWAPQAFGARLSILQACIEEEMLWFATHQRKGLALITRARRLGNRRNDVLHHVWGLDHTKNRVTLGRPPASRHETKPIPLNRVEQLIYDIRILITDVDRFIDQISLDENYVPSRDRPSRLEARRLAAKVSPNH